MFFDFIPNCITTLTILFPIYASHKALSAPPSTSPAHAHALFAPWLTYFVVLSLFNLIESYTPIIPSLPFYSFARLALHIYLLLPGPGQGSTFVYTAYIAPFLRQHEKSIEDFIKDAHDQIKSIPGVDLALQHTHEIWAYILAKLFGKDVKRKRDAAQEAAHAPPTANSYVASLLGRFIAPEVEDRSGSAQAQGAMAGLLSSALSQASGLAAGGARSVSGGSGAPARGEPLIPGNLNSDSERLNYIGSQRQRLKTLMSAFDREEETIHLAAGSGARDIARNRSEYEFETIGQEDVGDERPGAERRTSKGWTGWMFGKGVEGAEGGKSSGVDTGR